MVFKQIINYIKQNTYDIIFDIRYGLDTVSRVNLEDTSVGIDGKKRGNKYQPTGFSRSIAILKRIKKYGSKGLVDFGSGKGQVLLAASELGYSQIKGVEFVKEFHDIAVKNIAQWSNKQKDKFIPISICIDAAKYQIEELDQLFYFFYPFKPELMNCVIENIEKSLTDFPRPNVCIMLYPKDSDLFQSRQNWRLLETFWVDNYECRIYSFNLNLQ
jgi:hypothetical protein